VKVSLCFEVNSDGLNIPAMFLFVKRSRARHTRKFTSHLFLHLPN